MTNTSNSATNVHISSVIYCCQIAKISKYAKINKSNKNRKRKLLIGLYNSTLKHKVSFASKTSSYFISRPIV